MSAEQFKRMFVVLLIGQAVLGSLLIIAAIWR